MVVLFCCHILKRIRVKSRKFFLSLIIALKGYRHTGPNMYNLYRNGPKYVTSNITENDFVAHTSLNVVPVLYGGRCLAVQSVYKDTPLYKYMSLNDMEAVSR